MSLNTSTIPSEERLIFALDVASITEAKCLVKELGKTVQFYKIGLQLLMTGEYFNFITWLKNQNKKVFVDLKFFDVPQTVKSAITGLLKYDVDLTTVHGNDTIMQAATIASKGHSLKILAVTMLTSLDEGDVKDLGFKVDIEEIVLSRARRALACGCSGVISSGLEVATLRKHVDKKLVVVCPGIRTLSNSDDQKRTVNVKQAFASGADYIVVGRPIRESKHPKKAAEAIQQQIAEIFA